MSYVTQNGKLIKTRSKTKTYPEVRSPAVKTPATPLLKGKYMGLCNRSACLKPGPTWWNTGSRAYYCGNCACMINEDGCRRYREPEICHKVTGFTEDGKPIFNPHDDRKEYDDDDLVGKKPFDIDLASPVLS